MSRNYKDVLLVEDDLLVRTYLALQLRRAGYQIREASNGRQALEMLKEDCPDYIITDWMMPETDGKELCKIVRAETLPHYVYIIMMTAHTDSMDVVAGLNAGADDFVAKPIVARELVARLQAGERFHRVEAQLRFHVAHDPLTKLLNRRAFEEIFDREVKRALRYNNSLSCIMIDLDNFKAINDEQGHLAGDFALKSVAVCLSDLIRATDYACRYGGEEFAILLPETEEIGAITLAERMRQEIGHLNIEIDQKPLKLTSSLGVASLKPDHCDMELIREADMALLSAKKAGKNRVATIDDPGAAIGIIVDKQMSLGGSRTGE